MVARDAVAQDERHDLGVLFVHGIGEQREGRTLTSFTTALYTWLFHWNSRQDGERLRVPQLRDVVLSPSASGCSDEPAHGSMRTELRLADGTPYDRRWLLAESWWAEVFSPPRFADLARWLWKVSTCLLVLQFVIPMWRRWKLAHRRVSSPSTDHPGGSAERLPSRLRHGMWAVLYFVLMSLAAVISVPLTLLLFAVAVGSLLPIPRIDRAVQWVVVHLSAVLGDSYVLVRCPMEYAAMRTRVAANLAWLEKYCDKVVIVAHSQGAAIAHQMLAERQRSPDKLRAFVTVGQGIGKLHLLDRLSWDAKAALWATASRALVTSGLLLASFPALVALLGRWAPWDALPRDPALRLILYCAGVLLIAAGVLAATRATRENLRRDVQLPGAGKDYVWIDYYASADPVSNGPLERTTAGDETVGGAPGADAPRKQPCHQVYNQASILADHTSYLRNQNQFLSTLMTDLVAVDLACEGGRRVLDKQGLETAKRVVSRQVLGAAERARHRLVSSLIALRIGTLAVGALAWWWNPSDLLRGPADRMTASLPLDVPATDTLLRPAASILAMIAVYVLVFLPLWRTAERLTTGRFFHAYAPEAQPTDAREWSGSWPDTLSAGPGVSAPERTPETTCSR